MPRDGIRREDLKLDTLEHGRKYLVRLVNTHERRLVEWSDMDACFWLMPDGMERYEPAQIGMLWDTWDKQQAYREERNRKLQSGELERPEYGFVQKQAEAQGNLCAICEQPFSEERHPCVDHNPVNGRVRAVICGNCNSGLGMFKDNPTALRRAAAYVELFQPAA